MIIRPAYPTDAKDIAQLINMAMGSITFQFIKNDDMEAANHFMASLVSEKNNQYSFENIYVIQELDKILGHICIYDGANLSKLRQPILDKIKDIQDSSFRIEDETTAGEMYIDTFAIDPIARGKGLGKELLLFAIDYYVRKQKKVLGLLVDQNNLQALQLYKSLGFKIMHEKNIFKTTMYHMQIS